jgi:hypothetical protein
MRLGFRRGRGGEQRAGRMVNGTQAQVVPKGTIRAVMKSHRRQMLGLDDTAAREVDHIRAREEQDAPVPGMPETWTRERGRQELADIDARARRQSG